jgi:hypothetical protein
MAENEPTADAAHIKSFYSQLLHLLEFARDMDRNVDDGRFSKTGKIHYVLDENVFEFFVGARNQRIRGQDTGQFLFEDKRRYSAIFHLDAWRDHTDDCSKETQWIRVNRQTAVVTGEYLLCGCLPGQHDGRLYLTEWHWRELRSRFKILLDHFVSKAKLAIQASRDADAKEPPIDQIQGEIDETLAFAQHADLNADQLIERVPLPHADREEIAKDLAKLKKSEVEIGDRSLLNFTTARIIASKLIDDHIIEPLQQIKRIYGEIAPRLSPLQLLKPKPNLGERREIDAQARKWQARIQQEEELRGSEVRREPGRLAVDAASLAHVQWIAERLEKDGGRIVLVTGDNLVFDAYRRWWSDEPNVPFALRRITQYAPILNFRDAKSRASTSESIFENTRRAVEPALMFFNLVELAIEESGGGWRRDHPSTSRDEARRSARQRGREHFALLLKDKNALDHPLITLFTQNVVAKMAADRTQDHLGIRDRWQELERLAIGLSDLIELRLDNEQRRRLKDMRAEGFGMESYINETLDELYSQNAALYVPDTIRALRRWLRQGRAFTRRAPIAKRLRVALSPNDERPDISDFVEELITQSADRTAVEQVIYELESVEWLSNRPELLFAMASVVALRLALWNQAADYAQLAAGADTAARINAQPEREARQDYLELLYLRALANRFKLGDLVASPDNVPAAKELLQLAWKDLTDCIAYHRAPSESPHILRIFRALSERAALSLFYVALMLRGGDAAADEQERTLGELQNAELDLHSANAIRGKARCRGAELDEGSETPRYSIFFDKVEEQVTINTAACYVFRRLFEIRNGRPAPANSADLTVLSMLRDKLTGQLADRDWSRKSQEERADICAFLWLFDDNDRARSALAQLSPEGSDMTLRMDTELVALYRKMLVGGQHSSRDRN